MKTKLFSLLLVLAAGIGIIRAQLPTKNNFGKPLIPVLEAEVFESSLSNSLDVSTLSKNNDTKIVSSFNQPIREQQRMPQRKSAAQSSLKVKEVGYGVASIEITPADGADTLYYKLAIYDNNTYNVLAYVAYVKLSVITAYITNTYDLISKAIQLGSGPGYYVESSITSGNLPTGSYILALLGYSEYSVINEASSAQPADIASASFELTMDGTEYAVKNVQATLGENNKLAITWENAAAQLPEGATHQVQIISLPHDTIVNTRQVTTTSLTIPDSISLASNASYEIYVQVLAKSGYALGRAGFLYYVIGTDPNAPTNLAVNIDEETMKATFTWKNSITVYKVDETTTSKVYNHVLIQDSQGKVFIFDNGYDNTSLEIARSEALPVGKYTWKILPFYYREFYNTIAVVNGPDFDVVDKVPPTIDSVWLVSATDSIVKLGIETKDNAVEASMADLRFNVSGDFSLSNAVLEDDSTLLLEKKMTYGKYYISITATDMYGNTSIPYAFEFYRGAISTTITIDCLKYHLDGDSAVVVGGSSCKGAVTIPSTINYGGQTFRVTSIGESAFYSCKGLTSITIPNSVTYIGRKAFDGCENLKSVTLSKNLTSIAEQMFLFCPCLTDMIIPNSVKTIELSAFRGCTSLTSITIPSSVTAIGGSAFCGCSNLVSMVVDSENSIFDSRDNCNAIIETATNTLVSGCKKSVIPNGIKNIGSWAFDNCLGLTNIIIPEGVDSIGYKAFLECKDLADITLPNSVKSIGFAAFSGCNTLTKITIPNNVSRIEGQAFQSCESLTSVKVDAIEPPFLGLSAFPSNAEIFVPCGTLEAYLSAWSNYTKNIKYEIDSASYSISLIAINGDVSTTSTSFTICEQHKVICTAQPNYGYKFSHWNDGNTENPRTIILSQDTTFEAIFVPLQYSINVSCNASQGQIKGENGAFDYLSQLTYEAVPNYGYVFSHWSDDNIFNPRIITLTKDTSIFAIFAKQIYTITAQSANAEQGSVSAPSRAEYLDKVSILAQPNYGYHFTQWSDGFNENPRSIVLTQDTTFTAEFTVDKNGTCGAENALTWSFADDGTLTISGRGALTENYTFGVEAPTQMRTLVIGNEVTSIGEKAFYAKSTINHLIIGGNLASIGDYAFAECKKFDDITCYAQEVPEITAKTFENVGNKKYIYLYVPENRERAYNRDTYWGEFDVQVKGATSTTTTADEVIVEPTDNTATVTWPTKDEAATYTIEISKDGVVFCRLIFNANGQLTGIAFAPSRTGHPHAPSALQTTNGLQFTVTGLNAATYYSYTIQAKDNTDKVVASYEGHFTTTGDTPTALDQITNDQSPITNKVIQDGRLLILRGDKVYTITGQELR